LSAKRVIAASLHTELTKDILVAARNTRCYTITFTYSIVIGGVEVGVCVVFKLACGRISLTGLGIDKVIVAGQTQFEVGHTLEVDTCFDSWSQSGVNADIKHYWVNCVAKWINVTRGKFIAEHDSRHCIRLRNRHYGLL